MSPHTYGAMILLGLALVIVLYKTEARPWITGTVVLLIIALAVRYEPRIQQQFTQITHGG